MGGYIYPPYFFRRMYMKNKILTSAEISALCGQLYIIVRSGISVSEGISLMNDSSDGSQKKLLDFLYEKMENGSSLSDAVKESSAFPNYACLMLESGEKTGHLDSALKSLSDYYERKNRLSESLQNAVLYPLVLFIMLLFTFAVIVMKVMPVFNSVFIQLGTTMSAPAQALLNFGVFLSSHAVLFIAVVAVLFVLAVYFFGTEKGREKVLSHFEKSRLSVLMDTSRFASVMAMSLFSGLTADEAVEEAEKFVSSPQMRSKIAALKEKMDNGEGFETSVSSSGIFSPLFCGMLSIGFKTGRSDEVMSQIAEKSDEDVRLYIERIVSAIEPALVIIMSVMIGGLLLTVMLPLMNIMSSMG